MFGCVICSSHAFGDQYKATDFKVEKAGKLEMTFTPEDGSEPTKYEVYQFKVGGQHWLRSVSGIFMLIESPHTITVPVHW